MGISIYEQKADYVAKLRAVLSASDHFDSIDYSKDYLTDLEYVRIRNAIGDTFYINVTGNSEAAILMEVAKFVTGNKPTGMVTGKEGRLLAAQAFRKVV